MQTIATTGLGRVGIKKIIMIEADKVQKVHLQTLGKEFKTTQEYETFKQLAGLSPAVITNEGQKVSFDDMSQLHSRNFYPVKRTKGVKITIEAQETDQYRILKNWAPHFGRAFAHALNQAASNIDINGFTTTTDGMNSETLYSTSHNMGNYTGANRPAIEVVFGPAGVQQCLKELRKQKSARNTPMPTTGDIKIKVPNDLEFNLAVILESMKIPGNANNDENVVRNRITGFINDYYTSATAWFAMKNDPEEHGLFILHLLAYQLIKLGMDEELVHKWVAYQSYVCGWYDWHGTWGTTG